MNSICPSTPSFILFPALSLILFILLFLMHVSARLTAASAADQSSFPPRLFSQSFSQKCLVYQHFLSFLFLIQPASAGKQKKALLYVQGLLVCAYLFPFFRFSFLEKDIFKRRFLDSFGWRLIIFYSHSIVPEGFGVRS